MDALHELHESARSERPPSPRVGPPRDVESASGSLVQVPPEHNEAMVELDGHRVRLTQLRKVVWPHSGVTKGALLRYYLEIAPILVPHLARRPLVMRRYPSGIDGEYFIMKRAPTPRPKWVRTCATDMGEHAVIDDAASLAWVANLGCIELTPWAAFCEDLHHPDSLRFDIDPGDASIDRLREVALFLHEALERLAMPNYVKTSGTRGLHVSVPIALGPSHEEVWAAARVIARDLAERYPKIIVAERRTLGRSPDRVLVDYSPNLRGATLPCAYSVGAGSRATVSTPIGWDELERGITIDQLWLESVPARVRRIGDLWAPLAPGAADRFALPRASALPSAPS